MHVWSVGMCVHASLHVCVCLCELACVCVRVCEWGLGGCGASTAGAARSAEQGQGLSSLLEGGGRRRRSLETSCGPSQCLLSDPRGAGAGPLPGVPVTLWPEAYAENRCSELPVWQGDGRETGPMQSQLGWTREHHSCSSARPSSEPVPHAEPWSRRVARLPSHKGKCELTYECRAAGLLPKGTLRRVPGNIRLSGRC